jgi:hypothetical protein
MRPDAGDPMMETAMTWGREVRGIVPWFVVEALLPGAALFALLLWLSLRFVHEGFGRVRQHAFAPVGGRLSPTASAQRNWWSCTCVGACACLTTILRGLRRCCEMFPRKHLSIPSMA